MSSGPTVPAGWRVPAGWDLRLAGMALATWLSALLVLHAGVVTGLVLAVAAAASTVLLFGVRPDRTAVTGAVLGVLVGVVCGTAATAARVAVRDAPVLAALVAKRETVHADLVVRDDPRRLRGDAGRPATYAIAAELRRVTPAAGGASLRLDVRVLVLASDPAWLTVLPGQSGTMTGRLAPARGGDLRAAVLTASGPPDSMDPAPWHQRAAGALRAGLQRACAPLPDAPGGLLPGLVVGDTSALDPELADDFRATGLTHLVAVSGTNVAIVAGAVLLLARWCRAGPRLAAGLGLLALVGFVVLARPSPSVLRAGVMGAIALLALATARRRAAVPALCAAVIVLVVADPELCGDPGFALSVVATGGLLFLAPSWRDGLRGRGVPAGPAEALAVPAAAQVACAPVVAALSGGVSLVAVPANLLAVPAVAPATILGVMAAVLSPVWPAAAGAVAWLAQWPAQWLVLVARHGADVPSGVLPWPSGAVGGLALAVVLAGLLFFARYVLVRRLLAVVTVAVVLGALPVRLLAAGWPPAGWVVVACAVGQGDTVVLPAGPRRVVVVDAGPDPAATDRCLSDLGVAEVSLLVVTHFHVDHVGGIAGVFRGRRVGAVATPSWPEPASGRSTVDDAAQGRGTPVRPISAGWAYRDGPLRLDVLGPPRPLSGTRSDPNNNSLVVRVHAGGVSVLLAGDAEGEEQAAVLAAHGPEGVRCDVLKVPHHGSSYQDVDFLDATRPRVALVSVGTGNPYGHPNAAVLARLAAAGARVLRTDLEGDAAAVVVDGRLAVVTRPARPP